MVKVKELTKDNFTLIHLRYINDIGFLVDGFDIEEKKTKKEIVHYPFITSIKVKNYNKDNKIGDNTSDYTNKEYKEMLNKEIIKIKEYGKNYKTAKSS